MSNYHLSKDKQITVTAALAEGSSIRSIERIHRDTIMRLGVRVGQGLRQTVRSEDAQSRLQADRN